MEGDAYNLREATIPFHILLPFPIERGGEAGNGVNSSGKEFAFENAETTHLKKLL